jgi:hypothetical protein
MSDVVKLSREQRDAIVAAVVEHGRERRKNFGKEFNEIDFLCGAMAAFFALNSRPG